MTEAAKKTCTVISLISGKGGVGKTSVSLAFATVLGHFGNKVLLIDFDLATHGMSYFFVERISREAHGIMEGPTIEADAIGVSQNVALVPSTTRLSEPVGETSFVNEAEAINNLKNIVSDANAHSYDYVIVDCQAGVTETVVGAVHLSHKVVIVSEADPVSTWAVKRLEYAIGRFFPPETFGLINKLFIEDEAASRAFIEYVRILKHLPPLPFDREVIKAFMRKRIPVDLETPSAFVVGTIQALRDLLPEVSDTANAYLQERERQKVGGVRAESEKLENEERFLRRELMQMEIQQHAIRERSFQFLLVSFLVAGIGGLLYFAISTTSFFASTRWFSWVSIGVMIALVAGIGQVYFFQRQRAFRRSLNFLEETEFLTRRLAEVRQQKDKYRLLLEREALQ